MFRCDITTVHRVRRDPYIIVLFSRSLVYHQLIHVYRCIGINTEVLAFAMLLCAMYKYHVSDKTFSTVDCADNNAPLCIRAKSI